MTQKAPGHLAVETVIKFFGGGRALARHLKIDPAAISKWKKTGSIPTKWRLPILELSRQYDLGLTSHDLDYGRQDLNALR